ncbi:hypothetical protein DFP73DRAFT_540249 [Morchella snyderi]|nr:hypothetical protein DFP73DRAFT_540249 [Morchella snyderi]
MCGRGGGGCNLRAMLEMLCVAVVLAVRAVKPEVGMIVCLRYPVGDVGCGCGCGFLGLVVGVIRFAGLAI